jgi:hypothetical protein
MCKSDYSDALDALGANAAGLLRKFTLSRGSNEIASGSDCVLFGPIEDDQILDCDDDGDKDGPLDGPICVTAQCLGTTEPQLIPKDGVNGWTYEASTNSVRFNGSCVPAPNTEVQIRYPIRAERDRRQCGG